jgi:hypothetical protein
MQLTTVHYLSMSNRAAREIPLRSGFGLGLKHAS